MQHHPVFSSFVPFSGSAQPGEDRDFIGGRWKADWGVQCVQREGPFTTPPPPVDEQYPEWIDVLSAVNAANDRFVMLELGAGFGRWGIRGALAAKARGIPEIIVRLVEGEPQHAQWARDAALLNGLAAEQVSVIEAAISYSGEPVPFLVGQPDGPSTAASWYGQALAWERDGTPQGTYHGKQVRLGASGYRHVLVDAVTFEQTADGLGAIDIVDMDLQGAEIDVIRNSLGTLSETVRRIHIGTHSRQIEDEMRERFRAAGWTKVWDFQIGTTVATEFGPITFGDGIQGWINPRLS
jgi:FkbM family methyltransferase